MNALSIAALFAAATLQISPSATPAKASTIRGRILRADGRGLPRAQVRLVSAAFDGPPRSVEADVDGRYEFTEVSAGSYTLSASKGGYVSVEFGQRRAFERGSQIKLAEGETLERVDLVLPRHSAISGRIVDESGDPVEGASVRVLQIQFVAGRRQLEPVPGAAAQRTNDLGRYRLYGLQPGRFIVSASVGQLSASGQPMADMPGYADTYYPGTPSPGEAQFVTVGLAADVGNVDFSLVPVRTARISGTVFDSRGEPAGGSLVLIPSRRSGAVTTTPVGAHTGPGGSFDFRNVPPGEYVVQAYKGKQNSSTEGEFAAQFVTVNGSDVSGLVVQTSVGSIINGRVTLEGGSGGIRPADVELSTFPVDVDLAPQTGGPPARAEIYNDWTFEILGVSGPRRLHLVRAPPRWALKAILLHGSDITDKAMPFGTTDQSLRDVEVVLTRQISEVSGTVTDGSGHSIAGCAVLIFAVDREHWYQESRFLKSSRAGQDGTFSLRGLPPDEYFIAALDSVQGNEWQDPAFLDSIASRAARMTLMEGQTVSVSPKLITR